MKLQDLDDIAPPRADRESLTSVRRRGRRLKQQRLAFRGSAVLLIAVGLVAGVTIAGGNDATHRTVSVQPTTTNLAVGAPSTFVSTRQAENRDDVTVAISDARTAKTLQTLLTVPFGDGTEVTGTAIAPTGEVWITLNRGPRMLGHVEGGNPQPHTCASTLLRIDPRTGEKHTESFGNDDQLISDIQPSPTGDRIAYLESGCTTSYFGNSLRVKDLATGSIVSVGAAIASCHVIRTPRWTRDGLDIALVYGEATGSNASTPGTCGLVPKPSQLVTVSAEHSQPGVVANTAPVDPGCEVNAVAVTSDGFAGVEHCGPPLFISGPTRLVRYDHALQPVSRSPLGQCENGASIAGTYRSDALIISTYQFCGGSSIPPPTTKVFADPGTGPELITSLPGGNTAVDIIAF